VTTPIPGMPVPPRAASGLLLSGYQKRQGTIAVRAATAIADFWNRYVIPSQFNETWNALNPLIQGVIATHYDMTAAEAAQYYGAARVTAGFKPYRVPGAELDLEYLARVVNSMGAGKFNQYLKDQEPDAASTMARDGLRGAGTRMVLLGGRETITQTAINDPVALGWERVITPGACGFCSMLAGRGGVYTEATVGFRAHDHCACVARVVFQGQKSVNEELSAAWGRETRGYRGKAAVAEWTRYWESSHGIGPGNKEAAPAARPGTPSVEQEQVGRTAIPY
jgi:hypothetical protein